MQQYFFPNIIPGHYKLILHTKHIHRLTPFNLYNTSLVCVDPCFNLKGSACIAEAETMWCCLSVWLTIKKTHTCVQLHSSLPLLYWSHTLWLLANSTWKASQVVFYHEHCDCDPPPQTKHWSNNELTKDAPWMAFTYEQCVSYCKYTL